MTTRGRAFVRQTVVFVLLGVLASCRQNGGTAAAPRPRLGAIDVEEASADPAKAGPLDTAAIAGASRKILLSAGLIDMTAVDAAPAGAVLRVKITAGVEFTEVEKKGVLRAGVGVRLKTRPSDAPNAIEEDLTAGGEQAYAITPELDRHALAQRLVERTLNDVLAEFVARARLRTAPAAEIHAAITTRDGGVPAVREEAIRMAGARGMREEIPVLLPLLQDEHEAVRDAALGALIALREQKAVTELTRNRSLRDRHEMRKILEAIAIIGGDEAKDYLNFVAQTHDDEEIRKLAADAKARMERRPK